MFCVPVSGINVQVLFVLACRMMTFMECRSHFVYYYYFELSDRLETSGVMSRKFKSLAFKQSHYVQCRIKATYRAILELCNESPPTAPTQAGKGEGRSQKSHGILLIVVYSSLLTFIDFFLAFFSVNTGF